MFCAGCMCARMESGRVWEVASRFGRCLSGAVTLVDWLARTVYCLGRVVVTVLVVSRWGAGYIYGERNGGNVEVGERGEMCDWDGEQKTRLGLELVFRGRRLRPRVRRRLASDVRLGTFGGLLVLRYGSRSVGGYEDKDVEGRWDACFLARDWIGKVGERDEERLDPRGWATSSERLRVRVRVRVRGSELRRVRVLF